MSEGKETEPNEQKTPRDVTQEFLSKDPSEFRDFLQNEVSPNQKVTFVLDLPDAPLPTELRRLIYTTKGQISKVVIRATQNDHDSYPEWFSIPGVDWEEI